MGLMHYYQESKAKLLSRHKNLKEKKILREFRHVNAGLAADFIIEVQRALDDVNADAKYSYVSFHCPDDYGCDTAHGLIYLTELGGIVSKGISRCKRGDKDVLADIFKSLCGTKYVYFPCDTNEYNLSNERTDGISSDLRAFNPMFNDIVNELVQLRLDSPDMPMEEAMFRIINNIPKKFCKEKKPTTLN